MAFLEIHKLTHFPPSLINSDEAGEPKSAVFGGTTRQRWSPQSQKRAMRVLFAENDLIPAENLSVRTQRLPHVFAGHLQDLGHGPEEASLLAINFLWGADLLDVESAKDPRTKGLVYMGVLEAREAGELLHERAEELLAIAHPVEKILSGAGDEDKPKAKKDRKAPAALKAFAKSVTSAFDPAAAADLALFGRMIAQAPGRNIDGSLYVAHALGANAMTDDGDYFTAIDDLSAPEDPASAHIGYRSLTSSVLYSYHALDLNLLRRNLGGNSDLATVTAGALWNASVFARPTAMRTNSAPFVLPSLVLTVLRTGAPVSLVNALAKAVSGAGSADVSLSAARAITGHWNRLGETYGHERVLDGGGAVWHTHTFPDPGEPFPGHCLPIKEHQAKATARAEVCLTGAGA
jgi:CRISPR system Cascade subunit CasC